MIKDTLGERLSGSMSTQIPIEAEGFVDREVSLHREHRRSGSLFFAEDLSSTFVQDTVDPPDSIFGALNLD
jgi:hypothetical protein